MIHAANVAENAKIHTISHQRGVLPASLTLPHRVGRFERNSDESSRSLRILKRPRNGFPHNRIHFPPPNTFIRQTQNTRFLHFIKCCSLISGRHSVVLPSHPLDEDLQSRRVTGVPVSSGSCRQG